MRLSAEIILLKLSLLLDHVCVSARISNEIHYTAASYPDLRGRTYAECGSHIQSKTSLICDPDRILTAAEGIRYKLNTKCTQKRLERVRLKAFQLK